MKKVFLLFFVFALVGCQQTETTDGDDNGVESSTSTVDSESISIIFMSDGEEVQTETIRECWQPDCSEDSLETSELDLEELTKDLPMVPVSDSSQLEIKTEGPEPTSISYVVQELEQPTPSIEDVTLEQNEIDINGEGTKNYLVTATWKENEEFLGSITKAFNIEVTK